MLLSPVDPSQVSTLNPADHLHHLHTLSSWTPRPRLLLGSLTSLMQPFLTGGGLLGGHIGLQRRQGPSKPPLFPECIPDHSFKNHREGDDSVVFCSLGLSNCLFDIFSWESERHFKFQNGHRSLPAPSKLYLDISPISVNCNLSIQLQRSETSCILSSSPKETG